MCNAWNHWPGCDCGWGGGWHGASGSYTTTGPTEIFEAAKGRFSTYIDPNARCPVCGALVYFYKSPDGGRVFFDELGPPWPKHPCTDLKKRKDKEFQVRRYVRLNHTPQWLSEDWMPALVFINGNQTSKYYVCFEVLGVMYGRFVDCMMYNDFSDFLKKPGLVIYIRSLSEAEFEVIAYDLKTGIIERGTFTYAHPAIKRT